MTLRMTTTMMVLAPLLLLLLLSPLAAANDTTEEQKTSLRGAPGTLNCATVLCALPVCEPGVPLVTPEGSCCPQCGCENVICPLVACKLNEIETTLAGSCCPTCGPDCSLVRCARPICEDGVGTFKPEGACCEECESDTIPLDVCSTVDCSPGNECDPLNGNCVPVSCESAEACPDEFEICVPQDIQCIRAPCPQFQCQEFSCCDPASKPSLVDCGLSGCTCCSDGTWIRGNSGPTLEDSQVCEPLGLLPSRPCDNDSGDLCATVKCGSGSECDSLTGECVPVSCESPAACGPGQTCVDASIVCVRAPCPQFRCETGTDCEGDKVFNECGSACPKTCETKDETIFCIAVCIEGCFCPPGTVEIGETGQCVPPEECPGVATDECTDGKVFNECGSACPTTCANKDELTFCTLQCVVGCFCPPGTVEDDDGKCVAPEDCPTTEPDRPTGAPISLMPPTPPLSNDCQDGKEFTECGSACPETCDTVDNGPFACITLCVPGCFCPRGLVENTATGECVPKEDCPTQECTGGKEFTSCGSACPATCETIFQGPVPCLAVCVPGCFCPSGMVEDTETGDCVAREDCPLPECSGGKEFTDCGSLCPATCDTIDSEPIPCPDICVAGCFCPPDMVEDTETGECVAKEDCSPTSTDTARPSGAPIDLVPPTQSSDECPEDPDIGGPCTGSGTCTFGEESCCGETFPSLQCSCFDETWACFFTDACLLPSCEQDCSLVLCARPVCASGEVIVTPEGECCPVCEPAPPEECTDGKEFTECGSACPPTCDSIDEPVACILLCVPGCFCPPDMVENTETGECVAREDCPPPTEECTGGKEFDGCGSACPLTCENKDEMTGCTDNCVEGCFCPDGLVENGEGNCVAPDECPPVDSCALIRCGPGYECDNGECILVSCEAEDACEDGEVCVPSPIQCVTAPCPQFVCQPEECTGGKEYNDCGSSCPLTCENKDEMTDCTDNCVEGCFCPDGLVENGEGDCVAPDECPPVDSCALIRCGPGYECDNGECIPVSCEAEDACEDGEVCVSSSVQCVTAPCPQFVCQPESERPTMAPIDLVPPTPPNDECPDEPDIGGPCEGSTTCTFGEESCCGETFPSLQCECGGGSWECFNTDACLRPSCGDPPTLAPTVGCDTCTSGRYNDGCNECSCRKDGTVLCTKVFCSTPGQPFCIDDDPVVDCRTCPTGRYNDGCNECTCDEETGIAACTPNEVAPPISRDSSVCPPDRQVFVDFEKLPDGTPIAPGEYITNQFKDGFGFEVLGVRRNGSFEDQDGSWARIFDSSNPTGRDRDLGSPNKNCPGCTRGKCPGFSRRNGAGFLVANVTNCVAKHNILILHENDVNDEPDDNKYGGYTEFTFTEPIQSVVSIGLLDVENKGGGNQLVLLDSADNVLETVPIVGLGDNTFQEAFPTYSSLSATISKLRVEVNTSGAITEFKFCRADESEGLVIANDEEKGPQNACMDPVEPFCIVDCTTCPSGRYNDGCNTCFCEEDGSVACTEIACLIQGEPFCIDDDTAEEGCASQADCPNLEICFAEDDSFCGACFQGFSCSSDGDCLGGSQVCDDRKETCLCSPGPSCHAPCTADSDCGVGDSCSLPDGRCVPTTCSSDADCIDHFACGASACLRRKCTSDLDCAADDGFCVKGKCYETRGFCSFPPP